MGLRKAIFEDLARVTEIETFSYSSPWSWSQFAWELKNPIARFFVWEDGGYVVSYACYWVVAGEAYLANIAVDPIFRGKGMGRRMLEETLELLGKSNVLDVVLEVRMDNEVALGLYRSLGFRIMGRRPKHYEDGQDAWIMRLKLREVEHDGARDCRKTYGEQ
jgi:ribosomal-protein-alanine N-acetyltransferase